MKKRLCHGHPAAKRHQLRRRRHADGGQEIGFGKETHDHQIRFAVFEHTRQRHGVECANAVVLFQCRKCGQFELAKSLGTGARIVECLARAASRQSETLDWRELAGAAGEDRPGEQPCERRCQRPVREHAAVSNRADGDVEGMGSHGAHPEMGQWHSRQLWCDSVGNKRGCQRLRFTFLLFRARKQATAVDDHLVRPAQDGVFSERSPRLDSRDGAG